MIKDKKDKDISEVECYACGEKGHYANKCPSRQPRDNYDEEKHSHFTTASTFVTYHVHNTASQGQLKPTEILYHKSKATAEHSRCGTSSAN